MTALDYIVIVVYFAATTAIALALAGKQESLKDFFLGNRNVPWWLAAFSGIATIVSGASYLGGPGVAYKGDYTLLQYRVALPLAIFVLCGVLLPFFYRLQVYSIYEYLGRRFDRRVRFAASGLFVLLKTAYLAIVIYTPALVLAEVTGVPVVAIVLATGLVTTAYTLTGGLRAVVWTDALQLFVLAGGLGVALFIITRQIDGGLSGVWAQAETAGKLRFFNFSLAPGDPYTFAGCVIGGTFLMIAQFGADQTEMQRFLSTSSLRRARFALGSSMLVATALGFVLFFVGTALFVFYAQHPDRGGSGFDSNRIFAKFIAEEVPSGVTGLMVGAVLAASMSTVSAVLNSLATVAITDLYQRDGKREGTVGLARLVTCGFGLIGTVAACFGGMFGNVLEATITISNFFGGSLVGVFLLGMLVPRANGTGALAGLVGGVVVVLAVATFTTIAGMWFGAVSALSAFGIGFTASLLAPAPDPATRLLVVCSQPKVDR
ncbi:MAG: sodium/solute symporter [Opitutaceae bacterium]|nr:sodium/solute symporter [Opitutaceae bacterium]